ncbi:MAG: amidohydrolase [Cellulomonas sp.]|nr:amidohydrolase [Cellulomonas sp.]
MPAEILFTGGWVYDGSTAPARRTQLAVADGRVLAVGDDLDGLRTPATRVVDLAGAMVGPGFVDAHVHPVEGGLEMTRCDLSAAATSQEYLALIAAYAHQHPDEPWILGGGWQVAAFPGGTPLASELDAVVGDRPAVLSNRDHHGVWVSSAALRLAGIDASTPDPHDGRIERDAHGVPTGTLHEGARDLVARLVPPDSAATERAGLLRGQQHLLSYGITGWQDAIVGAHANHTDTGPVYLAAAQSGDLLARVVAALWWDHDRGLEQVPELIERRAALAHPRFRASSVKIMQDGIPENLSAGMLTPYLLPDGTPSDRTGLSLVPPELFGPVATVLDREGFCVHVHTIGDRAVREGLDAIAAARAANGPGGPRHTFAHVQVVHPDDVSRFAPLGVVVNMQALWASNEPQNLDVNLPLLGAERYDWQYPFGALWSAGASFAAGSDWPVTTPDPWAAIHVAVNRTLPRESPEFHPEPLVPAQALTLGQALHAYTAGSAALHGFEATGLLSPGAVADLAVVDRNPFEADVQEIHAVRTLSTWIDGGEVFTA